MINSDKKYFGGIISTDCSAKAIGMLSFNASKLGEIDIAKYGQLLEESKQFWKSGPQTEIMNRLLRAFARVSNGLELESSDYIPEAHELSRISRLSISEFPRYCEYRYWYNLKEGLEPRAFPACLNIEVTSVCNYRCVMCYQIDKEFTKKSNGYMGSMNFELFKRIIDDAEGNVEAVTIASRGEPLLCKNLQQMLDYCGNKFLDLKLNTNASLLTAEKSRMLLGSGINTLVFSIDSADPQTYEKIRVNGSFDKVKANLETFEEIRRNEFPNKNLGVRLSGVKLNDSQTHDKLVEIFGSSVDEVALVPYQPWERAYDNLTSYNQTQPCSEMYRNMYIWWDGKVNPCDFDYKSTLSVGAIDVRGDENQIAAIWSNSKYQELRETHLARKRRSISICSACPLE